MTIVLLNRLFRLLTVEKYTTWYLNLILFFCLYSIKLTSHDFPLCLNFIRKSKWIGLSKDNKVIKKIHQVSIITIYFLLSANRVTLLNPFVFPSFSFYFSLYYFIFFFYYSRFIIYNKLRSLPHLCWWFESWS